MSMIWHQVIGIAIVWFLWHLFVKKHFYTQKNREDIKDEVDKWISRL